MTQDRMTFGSAENVTTLLARTDLTDLEEAKVNYLLAQASREFYARVANLSDRVAAGEIVKESVDFAAEAVVSRVLANPKAYSQVTETTGPFTRSATIDRSIASGLLYVGKSDLAHFLPHVGLNVMIGTARISPGLA